MPIRGVIEPCFCLPMFRAFVLLFDTSNLDGLNAVSTVCQWQDPFSLNQCHVKHRHYPPDFLHRTVLVVPSPNAVTLHNPQPRVQSLVNGPRQLAVGMVISEHGRHPLGHERVATEKRSDGLQSRYAEMQWLFGVRTVPWTANRPIIMVRGHEVVGRYRPKCLGCDFRGRQVG